MIKKIAHKVFSLFLALLVMFSTVSFTIEKHYCGETLIDISIFDKAIKCNMETNEMVSEQIIKKPCCKETVDVFEGQDQLKINSFEDLEFEQHLLISSLLKSYKNLFNELSQLIIPLKDYSPPDLVVDRQIIDQVFLI